MQRLLSACWDCDNAPDWLNIWFSTQLDIAEDYGVALEEVLERDAMLGMIYDAPWPENYVLEELVSRQIVELFDPTIDSSKLSSMNLMELRENAGISQDEAARYVGVPLHQWIKWENKEEEVLECYQWAVHAISTPSAWREICHIRFSQRGAAGTAASDVIAS